MRIEHLASKPDRAGRYSLRFEDGKTMRLYRQTVEDFGLFAGMELNESEFAKLYEAAGKMSAKMRAVRIVAASSVTKKDLRQRLIRKGEDPTQATEAVAWMEDLKLLDDRETARQIVNRCAAKGYGIARAKQALYEKQVPKEYWQEALEDYPDQIEKIMDFLRSRLKDGAEQRDKKRAIDALLRRGHRYADIRQALQQLDFDEEYPEDFDG